MSRVFRIRRFAWCLLQEGERTYRTPDGRRVTKNTPGVVRVALGPSEHYYGKVPRSDGKPRRVRLCTDKTASKQMLAKLLTDARLRAVGLADPFEASHKRPLREHVADYGRHLLAKGDTDKAIEILNQSVQMYPEYTDEHNAYEPLAEAYLKKGDKKAAIETLKKYTGYSDTAFKGNIKLAGLLLEAGDTAEARRAFEGALYIRPMDMEEHQKYGELLLSQKQYAPAVREFEALIALDTPDKAGTYTKLAESDFGRGDRQSAKANVMKALEIAPSYEPALELLLKVR